MIAHSTPDTTPTPVRMLAPPVNSVPQAAGADSSGKAGVAVEQQLEAFAHQQAAAPVVPLRVLRAAPCAGEVELLLQRGGGGGEPGGAVAPVGLPVTSTVDLKVGKAAPLPVEASGTRRYSSFTYLRTTCKRHR